LGSAGPRQLSLFWKILLSTSVAITLLLALAGWFARVQTQSVLLRNLQSELRSSFGAYESLWQSRAATLRSVSLVLSGMPDVRAAFQTNDRETIKDTAAEVWSKVSQSNALFLVADPRARRLRPSAAATFSEIASTPFALPRRVFPRRPTDSRLKTGGCTSSS